jgi:two-component system response regulator AtoC
MNEATAATVLVVDDEQDLREGLAETLRAEGHRVDTAGDGWEALKRVCERVYDVVLVDLKMPGPDGLLVLDGILREEPATQVVVITGHATVESAVEAMKVGAFDYVPKPFKLDQVRLVVRRAAEHKRLQDENRRLRQEVAGYRQRPMIGESAPMATLRRAIERVAPTSSTVLIVGETGTGKELVARAVHERSERADRPFVPISCGAVAEALLESQLFGHVRGAFTGATDDREGVFEAAAGGTLFLDEVGEVPAAMQVRLLRVLQEREVQRLGETTVRAVDVRLVAATHRDLAREVQEGRFRQDLYYRLDVATLTVPPLRQRREDIEPLAGHFVRTLAAEMGRATPSLSADARAALASHDWPGNVRELENAVERALLFQPGDVLTAADIDLGRGGSTAPPGAAATPSDSPASLAQVEREHILRVLADCGHNQTRAAALLGIGRRTLYRKLREFGVDTA